MGSDGEEAPQDKQREPAGQEKDRKETSTKQNEAEKKEIQQEKEHFSPRSEGALDRLEESPDNKRKMVSPTLGLQRFPA